MTLLSKKNAVLAAAVGGGLVMARRRAAARGVDNPAPEPLPVPVAPPAGRPRTVQTEDGVDLSVVEYGAQEPTATVVLAHGYVQSSALWAGQVRDLVDTRPDLRVVTYDHRGHGRSGPTVRERANLAQLGRDLARVIDAVAPAGPVVVAGHSMGGMTVMALAEEHPELIGERVVGAALVGTSAGGLSELTFGLPAPVARLVHRLLPVLNERAVKAELAGKPRRVGPFDARMIFPKGVDPRLVEQALDVHRQCTAETVAAFHYAFADHDRVAALEVLSRVPSVVVVGDKDALCPIEHSRIIARALPGSELVVYPGVGHMVHMERRAEVSRVLVDLVDRALKARDQVAAV
jgi:pimeloyl-ACP methyl ester carboxylesterase